MKTPFELATEQGRDYITPEDIGESFASGYPQSLLWEMVLRAISGSYGFGCEDVRTSAWVALNPDTEDA